MSLSRPAGKGSSGLPAAVGRWPPKRPSTRPRAISPCAQQGLLSQVPPFRCSGEYGKAGSVDRGVHADRQIDSRRRHRGIGSRIPLKLDRGSHDPTSAFLSRRGIPGPIPVETPLQHAVTVRGVALPRTWEQSSLRSHCPVGQAGLTQRPRACLSLNRETHPGPVGRIPSTFSRSS
jgi:hypothetical protein